MFSKKELKTNLESSSALLTGTFLFINIISSSMLLHISFPITAILATILTIFLLGVKAQLEDKYAEKSQKIIFALLSNLMIACVCINTYIILSQTNTLTVNIIFAFSLLVDSIFIIVITSKLIMKISNFEYILYSAFLAALYFKMEIFSYLNNVLPILAQMGVTNCIGLFFLAGAVLTLSNSLNRSFIDSVENGDGKTCVALSLLVDNETRNKALKIAIEQNIPNKSIHMSLAKYADKENIELGITSAIDNSHNYLIKYFSDSNNITPGIFEKCLCKAIENNNHTAIQDIVKSSKITEETINNAINYANQNGHENCANIIIAARQP